jgi:hypothetical protein
LPPILKRKDYLLIISLLTLITFVTLFVFRSLDDNRLTSWRWIFSDEQGVNVFFGIALGILLSTFLLKVPFSVRRPGVLLFLLSFSLAAVFWRIPEVIVDASRYFTQAKHLELYGIGYFFREWGRTIVAWTDMPLVPFLYGVIFTVFGESRLPIQIFTTLLFSMTVILTYLIGKELWDEETGFLGGILLLGIPYLFIQVPLMLVDVATMFFLTLAIFAFIKALTVPKARMILFSSITLFLVFFSKYSTWLMLSVFGIILLAFLPAKPMVGTRNVLSRGAYVILLASLLIGAVLFSKYEVFSEQIRLLMSYQKPGLNRWHEGFVSTFLFQMHPFITVSALISPWFAFRKRDPRYAIICWLMVLVFLLQIKRIRYIIMVFPMLTLMASYGLQQVHDSVVRRFIVACIIISSLTVAVFAYLPFTQKMSAVNLKHAGAFLDSLEGEDIEVLTMPQEALINPSVTVPLLDLFTKKRITYQYRPEITPHDEGIKELPLRFTWEYKNPEYYRSKEGSGERSAVVVISDDVNKPLHDYLSVKLKGYRIIKVFSTDEGVFQYKTLIAVYRKEGLKQSGNDRYPVSKQ